MKMPLEFVRQKFYTHVVSDYLANNVLGVLNVHINQHELISKNTEAFTVKLFSELYFENGKKSWYVPKSYKSWVADWNIKNEEKDACETVIDNTEALLALYPDLRADIEAVEQIGRESKDVLEQKNAELKDGKITIETFRETINTEVERVTKERGQLRETFLGKETGEGLIR